nr:polyprotein [Armillaria bunya-like virus 2]
MSEFTILDLITNVPLGVAYSKEPTVWEDRHNFKLDLKVNYTGRDFMIYAKRGSSSNSQTEPHVRINMAIDSHELKNVRHDLVASFCQEDTDVKFEEIVEGVEDLQELDYDSWLDMSPDGFCKENRTMIELGTNLSNKEQVMKRDFEGKYNKYSPYLDAAAISRFYVLIVSQNKVVSNLPLTDFYVSQLCHRCRLGASVEAQVTEILGYSPFLDVESNERLRLIEMIFKDTKRSELEDVDFNHDMVEIGLADMTQEERNEVSRKFAKLIEENRNVQRKGPEELTKYLKNFTSENSRRLDDNKRICNIPFVISWRTDEKSQNQLKKPSDMSVLNDLPPRLRAVWKNCFNQNKHIPLPEDQEQEQKESEAFARDEKHKHKKHHSFKCTFNDEEKLDLAESGIGAKDFNKEALREKEEYSHRSFRPDSYTKDIEDFVDSEFLTRKYDSILMGDPIFIELLRKSKQWAEGAANPVLNSVSFFKDFVYASEFICFSDLVSCIISEVALSCKQFMNKNEFCFRYLRYYKVGLLVKNSGTHVFVSIIYEKAQAQIIDTGRLGPEVFEVGEYYVSDWMSFLPESMEHLIRCGPVMGALLAHMISSVGIDPLEVTTDQFYTHKNTKNLWGEMKFLLLIFLNNKVDLEETITSHRYFFMNILDEISPDPYKFVQRLPDVIRSRLTSLMIKRSMSLMEYYYSTRVKKILPSSSDSSDPVKYLNLRTLFSKDHVTLQRLIDSFYFGYVVSKEKSVGAHNNFAICKKLFSEEFKYLMNREKGLRVIADIEEPNDHQADRVMLKHMLVNMRFNLEGRLGENYKDIMKRDILQRFAKTNFSELATLKASARHEEVVKDLDELMGTVENLDYAGVSKKLREQKTKLFKRRPKVLRTLSNLADEFEKDGKELKHVMQLVPFALAKLEESGHFVCDLFPKSQHGGAREIHVLEVSARMVQFVVETIARVVCGYFDSETLTHPKVKDSFVKDHYREATLRFGDFMTFNTSGDKKTWCQGHHAVRFCAAFTAILHKDFHNILYRIYYLWITKQVSMPMDLIAIFLANEKTPSADKTFSEMRKRFYSGEAPFNSKGTNMATIRSGMFQGILHFSSSFYHVCVNETMDLYTKKFYSRITNSEVLITSKAGSDDYGVMASIANDDRSVHNVKILYQLMKLRAQFAHFVGITDSDKTALFLLMLIEYNSEWFTRAKSCKPSIKWIIASHELNLVENFVSRIREYYNSLTQALEGGSSTFECSIVQLTQAWMHYKLLGMDSQYHYKSFVEKLCEIPDPSVGFYPLEPDLTCGMTGLDFSLYQLAKNSKLGSRLIGLDAMMETDNLDYNARKGKILGKELSSYTINFSDPKKWRQMLKETNVESEEEIHEYFDRNPELAFSYRSTWKEDRLFIAMKLYSSSVRKSMSSHQPTLRMMLASSYILNRKCFKVSGTHEKKTLLEILDEKRLMVFNEEEGDLSKIFPHHFEYEQLSDQIQELSANMIFTKESYSKKSKVTIEIFSDPLNDLYPLLSLCQRKWFKKKAAVKVGKGHFDELWKMYTLKYPMIRDTVEETMEATNLGAMALRNYLEGVVGRSRKIRLQDTNAKGSTLTSVISRIFWPGVKLRLYKEITAVDSIRLLRSNIFSLINYFYNSGYTSALVIKLIKDCDGLNRAWNDLPSDFHSLKLFREVLENRESREILIERMRLIKGGTLGYFSVRQKFDRKSRGRVGPGEWRGCIGSTSIILEMFDSDIIRVRLSHLTSISHLAPSLRLLLKELKLKVPEKSMLLSKENLYYSVSGVIKSSHGQSSYLVPITLDKEIHISVLDQISKTNWKVVATSYTVKLVFSDKMGTEVTLLSERFTQRDWEKDGKCLIVGDEAFKKFHTGHSVTPRELTESFQSLIPAEKGHRKFAYLKRKGAGIYNLKKLEEIFSRMWNYGEMSMKEKMELIKQSRSVAKELEYDLEDVDDTLKDIFSSYDGGVGELPVFGKEKVTWDSGEVDDLHDIEARAKFLDEGFDKLISMELAQTTIDAINANHFDSDVMEIFDEVMFGMPRSNNFFSQINEMFLYTYPNVALSNIISDKEIPFSGYLGDIASMISGSDKREMDEEEDEDDLIPPSLVASGFGSSLASSVNSNKSISRMQEKIDDLERDILAVNGYTKNLLILSLKRMNMKLKIAQGLSQDEVYSEVEVGDVARKEFLISLFKEAFTHELGYGIPEFTEDDEMDDRLYVRTLETWLFAQAKEKLEEQEIGSEAYQDYRKSILKMSLSEELLDLCALSLGIDIVLQKRGSTFYRCSSGTEITEEMVVTFIFDTVDYSFKKVD